MCIRVCEVTEGFGPVKPVVIYIGIWKYYLFYFGGLGLLFCLTKFVLRVTRVVFLVISGMCCIM